MPDSRPSDQRLEQNWETPALEDIPGISRAHVAALETTDDDAVWTPNGQHLVVLTTVGRRSGTEHKVALPLWWDPEGVRVVVASFAGARGHPAWYVNLADRSANPTVAVRAQGHAYRSVPDILDGDAYRRTWDLLTADRAWYLDYQAKTERRIPLVRLPETGPA